MEHHLQELLLVEPLQWRQITELLQWLHLTELLQFTEILMLINMVNLPMAALLHTTRLIQQTTQLPLATPLIHQTSQLLQFMEILIIHLIQLTHQLPLKNHQ